MAHKLLKGAAVGSLAAVIGLSAAFADSIGPIDFEPPTYSLGDIDGQDGWTKTGAYDVEVADLSAFPNAAGFGFETQALRVSNAVASGSFGDQAISPALTEPAGETTGNSHYEASFDIGSTSNAQQPGLFVSISPDNGQGSRMSYVGFEDEADGIHVIFFDATNPGPIGTVASFNATDVATLSRDESHSIRFSIDFIPGPGNDIVELYVDDVLVITGTTWEDYYRYDPEQAGNGNVVPVTDQLIILARGAAAPDTSGNGYLIDNLVLSSSSPVATPADKDDCKNGGWENLFRDDGTPFANQGLCIKYVNTGS